MSKPQAATTPAPAPASRWNPDLLRRLLLVLVTALLVARPLVPGEDPGLLSPAPDAGGLTLALLWLVAALVWAVWRLWSGEAAWQGGLAEAGLLLVAGLMFTSAGAAASYKHPAWLIAWQWLVLLVLFSLVRQLARAPAVRHGLLAAVVATGVSAAAFGIYQAAYEQRHTISSTFVHPDNFAGYLTLLLPAAVGFGVVAWRRRLTTWQPVLALTAAGVIAVALVLTRSRGAVLSTVLVGAFLALWWAGCIRRSPVLTAFLMAAALAGATLATAGVPRLQQRLDDWTATWAVIPQHPWLGVGPGNFSRHFPRYMPPTAEERAGDPRNFALEVWVSAGVFGLAALLAALAGVFAALRARLSEPAPAASDEEPPAADSRNWEFYVGGMVGLLLSYLLRAAAAGSSNAILVEGAAAAARSVVWFAAFGLFLSIPWSGPGLARALAAGLAACLFHLCFSAGIDLPSVAGPFWAVAALAVARDASPKRQRGDPVACAPGLYLRSSLALFLPVPALAGLCLVYLIAVFVPLTGADTQLRQARLAQARYRDRNTRPAAPVDVSHLVQYITNRLEQARRDDPDSATPHIALAAWHLELLRTPAEGEQALRELGQAIRLDPDGKEERMLHFQAHLRLAEHFEAGRRHQLDGAAEALAAVVALDPSESARLHYRLADTLLRVGRLPEGYGQLLLARQEDESAPGPAYRLPPAEAADAERLLRRFFAQVVGPALEPPPWGPVRVVPAVYPRAAPAARPGPAPPRRPLLPGPR